MGAQSPRNRRTFRLDPGTRARYGATMGERLTVLSDDRLGHLRSIVRTRLRDLAARAGTGAFREFFDTTMRALRRGMLSLHRRP